MQHINILNILLFRILKHLNVSNYYLGYLQYILQDKGGDILRVRFVEFTTKQQLHIILKFGWIDLEQLQLYCSLSHK